MDANQVRILLNIIMITISLQIFAYNRLSLDILMMTLTVLQMSQLDIYLLNDTHGYAETIATLRDIASNEILLHDGSKQRILTNKIQARFTDSAEQKVVFISRQVWIATICFPKTSHSGKYSHFISSLL